jgi:hypothetical protein
LCKEQLISGGGGGDGGSSTTYGMDQDNDARLIMENMVTIEDHNTSRLRFLEEEVTNS